MKNVTSMPVVSEDPETGRTGGESVPIIVRQSLLPEHPTWTLLGFIRRERGLWRDAEFRMIDRDGKDVKAIGMPSIIATLRSTVPDAVVNVTIEIHPGYFALYGDDGAVAARILRMSDGFHVRIMKEHASFVEKRSLSKAICRAFELLRGRGEVA